MANHNEQKTVKLAITAINTRLNQYDKLSISTVPHNEINTKGLFQMSEKEMETLADKVGAFSPDMLKNAVADGFDDSILEVHATFRKEGEPVLDNNGEEVIGDDGEPMKYTKDWWECRAINMNIILGEDAQDYISSINRKVDETLAMESRRNKSKRRKTRATTPVKQEVVEEVEETIE